MTILNEQRIDALPLEYFTSILGREIIGKKSMYFGQHLFEKCENKRFLITGINAHRSHDKLLGCSLYIEGIDNNYELDTSINDAFDHFEMPTPLLNKSHKLVTT